MMYRYNYCLQLASICVEVDHYKIPIKFSNCFVESATWQRWKAVEGKVASEENVEEASRHCD